jgi:hypothetical protein
MAHANKQTDRRAANWVAEKALTFGSVTICLSFWAGKAAVNGIRKSYAFLKPRTTFEEDNSKD